MAHDRSETTRGRASTAARVGYALIGLATAIAALGSAFPQGARWLIAVVLLCVGLMLVRRARDRKAKRPTGDA